MTLYSDRQLAQWCINAPSAMRDIPRYEAMGRADFRFGFPEVRDTWTGRTGVYVDTHAVGVIDGAYIRNGKLCLRHPQDNPFCIG
jgi:hypothetical protein